MPVRSRSTLSRLAIHSRAWREASITLSSSLEKPGRMMPVFCRVAGGSSAMAASSRSSSAWHGLSMAQSVAGEGSIRAAEQRVDGGQGAQRAAHGHQVARVGRVPEMTRLVRRSRSPSGLQRGAQLGAQQAVIQQAAAPRPGAGGFAFRSSSGLETHWRIRRLPMGVTV